MNKGNFGRNYVFKVFFPLVILTPGINWPIFHFEDHWKAGRLRSIDRWIDR